MAKNTDQSDYTETDQSYSTDIDSDDDDDIVELPPLAKHVDHEDFDSSYDKENTKHMESENSDLDLSNQFDKNSSSKRNIRNLKRPYYGEENERSIHERKDNVITLVKTHKCDFCQKLFRCRYELNNHIIAHGFKDPSAIHQDAKVKRSRGRQKVVNTEKVVYCDICKEYYHTDIELMVHKQDDHGVCSVCNITLPSCDTLQQHLDTHSDPTLQRCLICGSGFLARVALFHHINVKHTDPCQDQAVFDTITENNMNSPYPSAVILDFKCPYCRDVFAQKQDCLDHLQTHKSELKCKFCSQQFKRRRSYLHHLFEHSESRTVQCEVCISYFPRKYTGYHSECDKRILSCRKCKHTYDNTFDLTRHMIKHLIQTVLKCEECEEIFFNTVTLNLHKKQHLKENLFKCTICDIVFISENNLTVHNREMHAKEEEVKKHVCPICNKIFDKKANFSRHRERVHGPKLFKCQYCPKTFTTITSVRRHEIYHTGERNYKCDVCSKSFTTSGGLNAHKSVHSGVRAFKCSECEKSFKTQSQLRYHMFTHTGERPYVCDICGKGFTNQTHKKTHMRTHTGETPFLCQHCGAAYPTNVQLQNHVFTHTGDTGETPFLCQHCGASFTFNAQLQNHLRKHKDVVKSK